MKSNGKLTISRPVGGNGDEHILIMVKDNDSGAQFLSLEVGLEGFAKAVTGHGYIDCKIETRDLENVGKKLERSTMRFKMPDGVGWGDNKKVAIELSQALTPEGWYSDGGFNSQNSFYLVDGHQWAQTMISRWS